MKFLQGYSPDTLAQVKTIIDGAGLGSWLLKRYPNGHGVRTDKALYDYVQALKQDCLRGAPPLAKVAFDSKLHVVHHALGTHTTISRVQGTKLKSKREIRVATLFKFAPEEFLKMITVHELAHIKERAHDKAFYQLCAYMEPRYHQLEFEVRMYLTHLDTSGVPLWQVGATPSESPTQVKF